MDMSLYLDIKVDFALVYTSFETSISFNIWKFTKRTQVNLISFGFEFIPKSGPI